MFRVRLLGGFGVSVGGRVVEGEAWRLKKAKALVKMLALAPNHRLHRERVMDALWPRLGSASAANNLHHALHIARRAVGDTGFLQLEDEHLSLCPGAPLRVDVEEFEAAAAEARRLGEPAAYRKALELYTGDLLPEDLYEEWAENRRSELRAAWLSLLVEFAALCEGDGNFTGAVEAFKKVVGEEPTSEEAHGSLIRLYARLGWLAESVKQYQRLEGSLRRDLDVEPGPDARRVYQEALDGGYSPARPRSAEARRHNLSASLTSFVGREREMEEVKNLLGQTRLLTLAGAGGSGKTRLALEVGRGVVEEFGDGVWMVELAAVWDPGLVTQTVADVLSIHEQQFRPLSETLTDELRTKHLLLILDNCEHLVGGVAGFAEGLLGECPRLRILATSREVLRVPEEVVWRIPSLSLPDGAGSLEESAAARLFVERAKSRRPEFGVGERSARAVVDICRRLDGIPLAIELAAAKVGTLSVEQISARLDDRFRLLVGGSRTAPSRQQTMRAAIEWSDALLDEWERTLFNRLSVFAGGFSLEAAEAVGWGGGIEAGEVLDLLSRLVDKSRVMAEADGTGGVRYRMLETIRQYGREQLEESGEAEWVRDRHAGHHLALAGEAKRHLTGPDQAHWLEKLEAEHDNLRAALAWTLDGGDGESGLRLATALWLFWDARGHLVEGRKWLEKAISMNHSKTNPTRAEALNGAGWMALYQGDHEAAKRLLEESLVIYRELEDAEGVAAALTNLGFLVAFGFRDDLPVGDFLEEAMSLRPGLRDHRVVGNLLVFAGLMMEAPEGGGRGVALHEESLALLERAKDMRGVSTCLSSLGFMALSRGDRDTAEGIWADLIDISRELDKKVCFTLSFLGLASVAAGRGDHDRAARLWGATETAGEAAGVHMFPMALAAADYENLTSAARETLGPEAFEVAWSEGRAMKGEEAIEYAMQTEQPPKDALTPREREISALVAKNLTNRQVAEKLNLSKRTVDNHVGSILRKLNLDSREKVADKLAEYSLE